jgi:hypothetical protein
MLDIMMMTLTSGLTTNSYRRVSSGQASSCHIEPKGWGPLRLYLFILCIALCTSSQRQSLQLFPIILQAETAESQQASPPTATWACRPAHPLLLRPLRSTLPGKQLSTYCNRYKPSTYCQPTHGSDGQSLGYQQPFSITHKEHVHISQASHRVSGESLRHPQRCNHPIRRSLHWPVCHSLSLIQMGSDWPPPPVTHAAAAADLLPQTPPTPCPTPAAAAATLASDGGVGLSGCSTSGSGTSSTTVVWPTAAELLLRRLCCLQG